MKKSITAGAILAAVGVLSIQAAFAAPGWIDDSAYLIEAKPVVVKTTKLSMSTSDVLVNEGSIKPDQHLFTLNVSAGSDTQIALAAAGTTSISQSGVVRNRGGGVNVINGILPPEYVSNLTREPQYNPDGGRPIDSSSILLLSGEDTYNIAITAHPTVNSEYTLPGNYTYEFVAQAYTD